MSWVRGRQWLARIAALAVGIAIVVSAGLFVLARQSHAPVEIGLVEGRLRPCPDRPNCVCTHALSEEHRIGAIPFNGSADAARDRLLAVLESFPGATIRLMSDRYFHVEFRSRWFGFVDDAEFLIDPRDATIQFRSAARVGYSDFGANRARMEAIRRAFRDVGSTD